MTNLESMVAMLRYGDWANGRLHEASGLLADDQLDRTFDMGLGSLRRTLIHILAGESVWLQRWMGNTETHWPDELEKLSVNTIAERTRATAGERDLFLSALDHAHLARSVIYRDSKGSRFTARLADMMLQMCLHSHHHRAQAVNMLRRLGAESPELDYMMSVRKPA